jgi:hypothetical protein
MRRNQIDGWTTKDEIFFLENIGKFSDFSKLYNRNEMLVKYIDACGNRTDWDGMSKERVISHARSLLGA